MNQEQTIKILGRLRTFIARSPVDIGEWDGLNSDLTELIKLIAISAAQYGFRYSTESQHSGFVPNGNVLQWLLWFTDEQPKLKELRVGEDMICPVTKQHCDDECCPPGAICNVSGDDCLVSGNESNK